MKAIDKCPVCEGTSFHPLTTAIDYTVSQKTFNIVQCNNCTLAMTSPRPDDASLGLYYQSDQYISHTAKANTIIDRLYLIARKFTLSSKYRIVRRWTTGYDLLDYGAGTADFLGYMHGRGFNVTGIEPSTEARTIASKRHPDISIQPDLPSAQQFDIITLWHVLEHIPDLSATLQKLRSILAPNGRMFIAVPTLTAWESKYYGAHWAAYDVPRHLWHFAPGTMKPLLEKNRLRQLGVIPMYLDSFYISLLSEKYRNHGQINAFGMIRAFINGFRSNLYGFKTGNYSSLIYIIGHDK